MRTPRKYTVLLLLSFALIFLLAFGCAREVWRMPAAAVRQNEEALNEGAQVYAQNCVICHGPKGEGVIGLPLNRPDLQGDPLKKTAVYDMLYTTLRNGRPGNGSHPEWMKVKPPADSKHTSPTGYVWMSYTRMPNWHRDTGGPLQDPTVVSLVKFIMDGTHWADVGEYIPKPSYDKPIPKPDGFPQGDYDKVAKLLDPTTMGGTANCLSCHAIGSRGAHVGPDLSHVGVWTSDPANPGQPDPDFKGFLLRWLSDPNAVNDEGIRMPWYWSADRVNGVQPTLNSPVTYDPKNNRTQMVIGKLTDEQKDLIVRYLLSLK